MTEQTEGKTAQPAAPEPEAGPEVAETAEVAEMAETAEMAEVSSRVGEAGRLGAPGPIGAPRPIGEAGQGGQGERAGQAGQATQSGQAEQAEQARQAGQAEQAGQAGQATQAEQGEQAGQAEQATQAEQGDVAESAGRGEQGHQAGRTGRISGTERSEPQDVVPSPRPTEPSSPAPASEQVSAPALVPALAPAPAVTPDATAAPEPGLTATPTPTPIPARKDRRALRATLRWTAALLTFAAVGAGTAYGIAGMERTDVPGLATVSDGRWVYPTLTKAPLPSGSPGPLAEENKAGSHYADLRALVLPAPEGATVDKALSGTDGWLPTKDLLAEYAEKEDREELGNKLSDNGLRHIAARGWTTPDGTHTRIYLLQFDTAAVVDDLFGQDIAPYGSPGYGLRDAPDSVSDEDFPEAARIQDITASVYVESKPYGTEQARHAYISAGDVLALVVQSRKGTANPVPFQQTVTLQSQLLG